MRILIILRRIRYEKKQIPFSFDDSCSDSNGILAECCADRIRRTGFFGAEIPDASSIAYSENSFGAMIADTINQENARIMMSSVVHDVEMNGTEATVSYDSTQAGRAVVCVYEDTAADSAPRLLGTGIQAFTEDLNNVTVPVQISALPEYYLVRVYTGIHSLAAAGKHHPKRRQRPAGRCLLLRLSFS